LSITRKANSSISLQQCPKIYAVQNVHGTPFMLWQELNRMLLAGAGVATVDRSGIALIQLRSLLVE
ncbi:hypothetical protein, partial [Candidatus Erwinia dacicola]